MQRKRKLELSRETVLSLEAGDLRQAGGAAGTVDSCIRQRIETGCMCSDPCYTASIRIC